MSEPKPPATRIPTIKRITALLRCLTSTWPSDSNMSQVCRMFTFGSNWGKEIGRMSDVFPVTTNDERDPREDENEEKRREAEIKGDKPPHHD